MKKLMFSALIALMIWGITAIPVSREEAINTATAWHRQALPGGNHLNSISAVSAATNTEDQDAVDWYVISFTQGGFILVSADDKAIPVLGYDLESNWSDQVPENMSWFLGKFHQQFSLLRSNPEFQAHPDWSTIRQGDFSLYLPTRPVSPLLSTNWNQDWPYNSMCPSDNQGPGGHVYVGCMALSMGQIMKYWAYPTTGTGSHTYNHPTYGNQTANFGATTYNWAAMPATLNNTANTHISTLLYHCAVAVDMDFAPDGSGAQASPARNAFINYFNYENTVILAWKQSYTDAVWHTMLHTDLDASRPVLYVGYDATQGGHAWVCDGYQGTNYYHMNWGWDGYSNGYFYVTNLNPGMYHFNNDQGAIFRIAPPAPVAPPVNLTADVFDDNNVLLQWVTPPTRALVSYTVYRNGVALETLDDLTNTSYYDVNMVPGTYQYHIIANFSQGSSNPSNTATAVIYPSAVVNLQDSFDSYADFSAVISPWFTYDVDASATETMDGFTFPNSGSAMGFIAFNPAATTPPVSAITPYDGTKVMACFGATNGANDDWLVSPKWNTGSQGRIRFWAKSAYPANGLEQIKIGINTISPNPVTMSIISGTNPITVPGEWTEYNFTLTSQLFTNLFVGIQCVSGDGTMLLIDKVQLMSSYVDNDDETVPTGQYLSLKAYPNPFNPTTTLTWQQKNASDISVKIYDMKGRLINTLVKEKKTAGRHSISWNGQDSQGKTMPSGIYYVRLSDTSGNNQTQKLMLIK